MKNTTLLVVTAVLLLVSVFSYNRSIARAERFERGQKFLSQLNADNIHEIQITKGETIVNLRKSDDKFLVTSQHNYPAKNEAVNRFINDTLGIELEKNVGSSDDLAKELEVSEGEKMIDVVLRNDSGKDMVHFRIGKSSDDGRGNYVQRLDGDDQSIYLSGRGVYLSTEANNFLNKEVLDVSQDKIARIQGLDFVVEEKDGSLQLAGVPAGKKEGSDVGQVKGMLSGLSFENVFLADDSAVSSLKWGKPIVVDLKDNSGYRVRMATEGETNYLKIEGTYDLSKLEGITIDPNESEEELKKKSELLTRRDEITEFNNFHGSWVYELSNFAAKKFQKTKADLIEDETKDEG